MSYSKEIVPGITMVVKGTCVVDSDAKVVTFTSGTYIVTDTEYRIEKAADADPTLIIARPVSDLSKLNKPAPQARTPMPPREAKSNMS